MASPRLGEDVEAPARAFNRMAQRLVSVEATRRRLFGDLAHEIRTPVAVLDAYTDALEDGVRVLDADSGGPGTCLRPIEQGDYSVPRIWFMVSISFC